ncbi:MAG: hypothetical protein M3N35_01735 [Candidatus Binatota bacterium]|jgi:hypothetical protein|nr:hypothetical protein [Candidatus Binatota bacterium]
MLSDEEKQELRDMAASETLRTEFRVLRNNSRAIEQRLSVDDLARWLTAINRICPGDPKPRKRIVGTNFIF